MRLLALVAVLSILPRLATADPAKDADDELYKRRDAHLK